MKSLHRHLLTASLLAAFGIGAIAQTAAPVPAPAAPQAQAQAQREHRAERAEHFRERMQARFAKRLGHLKEKLQITPAQEGAWNAWTAALKPPAHQRFDRAAFARMTTPERIDRMKTVRAERNARAEQREDATKALYAQLSPAQQQTFDQVSLRMAKRHGHGGRWHHRGGHAQRGEQGQHGQRG